MNSNIRQWLLDALKAARLLLEEVSPTTPDEMRVNVWFRGAANYQLILIGEALNRIRREDPELAEQIPDVHEWISLRHIVAHQYDKVDVELVWDTITADTPTLIDSLFTLLKE